MPKADVTDAETPMQVRSPVYVGTGAVRGVLLLASFEVALELGSDGVAASSSELFAVARAL